MSRTRVIVIIVTAVVLVVGIACYFVGDFFYNYSLKTRRGATGTNPATADAIEPDAPAFARNDGTWLSDNAEDVWIDSADGLRLHGYMARTEGSRYAIVVHGYTGRATDMTSRGERFFEHGFSVLMPDLRGHGQSEGDYIGMGWPDRLDVLRWIDRIIQDDPDAEILLYGVSMGAATVMMTSGEAMPGNVKAVIEDCGYTSVWDEFSTQLKEQFGLPAFPVLYIASLTAKVRAGYWLGEASAVEQVEKSVTPTLFIHGDADTFVPFWMLEPLYEAAACEKEKLVIPGAGHGGAASADPELYWGMVDTFIDKHMPLS